MPVFRFGRPKFEVTADDVANAIDRDSKHCPIAETIARTLPWAKNVCVDLATIRWSDPQKGLRYIYLTVRPAAQFIADFDQGHKDRIKPFSFSLRPPAQIIPMARPNQNRGKKRVKVHADGAVSIHGGRPLPTHNGNIHRTRQFGKRVLIP